MKVALVHDYLREYGGAERVLEALHDMYPQAPVYTAFVDKKSLGIHWNKFKDWKIRNTWLADIPLIKKLYSPLRFLAPTAFADLDLSDFDIIISSSNAYYAKAVKVPNGKHLCYCHTPPRSLYGYSTMSDWKKNPMIRIFGELINHYLRQVDFKIAQQVDVFIANSEETQKRIKKFYRREATIVYPPIELRHPGLDPGSQKISKPVDSGSFRPCSMQARSGMTMGYYLYVNRLALAKHPELAVQACSELNLPLKLVGSGKMLESLKTKAGPSIEFLGSVTDEQLSQLYAGAKALIYPVEDEDFGMIPVEAMMHGVPVIAHYSGGPKETIIDAQWAMQNGQLKKEKKLKTKEQKISTGIFFSDLSADDLKAAIMRFEKTKFDKKKITQHAQKFSKQEFERKIKELLNHQ